MPFIDIFYRTSEDLVEYPSVETKAMRAIEGFYTSTIEPVLKDIKTEILSDSARQAYKMSIDKADALFPSDEIAYETLEIEYAQVYEFQCEISVETFTDSFDEDDDRIPWDERFIWDGKPNPAGIIHPLYNFSQWSKLSRFTDGDETMNGFRLKVAFEKITPTIEDGEIMVDDDFEYLL